MELHTPGGERGETGTPQGLSHAFIYGSWCTFVTPAPAKEVSIAPCATGHGPSPKGRPSSSSFMLPLCQRLERLMPRDILGCRCVGQGQVGPCSSHPTLLEPVSQPCSSASHGHSRGNAPHHPLEPLTQLLSGKVTRSPTWEKGS